ncbi:hypothetical protein CC78DRAFT_584513 [Lojkania enalia]|uniref:Peptidase C14 caspase domain-containing protein n=1 Tax=Lojkania enalia TaxID=147567 RepID=A0A9P4MWY9_9PLEO|nr:hypothetical protein CC78DRAFT_584513 [Didymosphaeria enalia]
MATQLSTAELGGSVQPHSQNSPSEPLRPNPSIILSGPSVIGPTDAEKKKESERQAWFQNAADEVLNIPTTYLSVAVLIVRWHEDVDDMRNGHDDEIRKLTNLFRGRFNYICEQVKLETSKNPQNELNFAISQHIRNYDGPNNLLIVYYTGHGRLDQLPGDERRLELSAASSSLKRKRDKYAATAFWDLAETPLLQSAESDVLAILDCCFASHAHKGYNEGRRTYELLCPINEFAPGPGPRSFTTALIKSLEELLAELKNRNFTTIKLLDKMNTNRNPLSMLHDRLRKGERHVQLAPLEKKNCRANEKSFLSRPPEKAWVKLRFSLKDPELDQNQIEKLARQLAAAFRNSQIGLRKIHWIKMESDSVSTPVSPTVGGTATAFVAARRLRRKSQTQRLEMETSLSPR